MEQSYEYDDLQVAADQRRAALDYVHQAFSDAIMAGLEADNFVHAALFTAFQELVATYGEDAVAKFAENLPSRILRGEFTVAERH